MLGCRSNCVVSETVASQLGPTLPFKKVCVRTEPQGRARRRLHVMHSDELTQHVDVLEEHISLTTNDFCHVGSMFIFQEPSRSTAQIKHWSPRVTKITTVWVCVSG